MDTFIIVLIILIGVINAVSRIFRERKRKEAARRGGPAPRPLSPIERFLRSLEEGESEITPPVPEEEPFAAELKPAPAAPEVQKRKKEPLAGEAAEIAARVPKISIAGDLTSAPLRAPALPLAPLVESGRRAARRIDASKAAQGIVMAEILGPPLSRRRAGPRARRLL